MGSSHGRFGNESAIDCALRYVPIKGCDMLLIYRVPQTNGEQWITLNTIYILRTSQPKVYICLKIFHVSRSSHFWLQIWRNINPVRQEKVGFWRICPLFHAKIKIYPAVFSN